jgi:hypothetical protein
MVIPVIGVSGHLGGAAVREALNARLIRERFTAAYR